MNQKRYNIDISEIFIEVYNAFPAKMVNRDDIELSNSIILPPSALKTLSEMKWFKDTKNPILFRILNIELNLQLCCGVTDFTAEKGMCYIPTNMFDSLRLMEGQMINLRNARLNQGTFIKLQPHKTSFLNTPDPKTIVRHNLKKFFCLTKGETISVKYENKINKLDVIECKPESRISNFNNNLKIELCPAKDCKEPTKD